MNIGVEDIWLFVDGGSYIGVAILGHLPRNEREELNREVEQSLASLSFFWLFRGLDANRSASSVRALAAVWVAGVQVGCYALTNMRAFSKDGDGFADNSHIMRNASQRKSLTKQNRACVFLFQ